MCARQLVKLVRNLVAHRDAREEKWRGNWRMEWVASTLTPPPNVVYPALLKLMRTPRLPTVNWTDAPTDLNGLVRFGERQNVVSARVPSRSARAILFMQVMWPLPSRDRLEPDGHRRCPKLVDFYDKNRSWILDASSWLFYTKLVRSYCTFFWMEFNYCWNRDKYVERTERQRLGPLTGNDILALSTVKTRLDPACRVGTNIYCTVALGSVPINVIFTSRREIL